MAMLEFYDDDDAATNFIERRWFAASTAVADLEDECKTLRAVMLLAEDAYRRARVQLAELTVLRDSLGECLTDPSVRLECAQAPAELRLSLSAA
jgi:hypothetical protein